MGLTTLSQCVGEEPDTIELHLYRQTFCKVEQPLLDKLARAQAALEKRLREQGWDADWKAWLERAAQDGRLRYDASPDQALDAWDWEQG